MRSHLLTMPTVVFLVFAAFTSGCGESDSGAAGPTPSFPATPRTVFGGARPVTIQVPHQVPVQDSARFLGAIALLRCFLRPTSKVIEILHQQAALASRVSPRYPTSLPRLKQQGGRRSLPSVDLARFSEE